MTDERRRIADGIKIDRELAEHAGVPEELDAGVVGVYHFPDPKRRATSGRLYLGTAIIVGALAVTTPGYWVMAGLLLVLAVWHFAASWSLGIDEKAALEQSAKTVPFTIGHASAAVTFHGWRSRPHWQVIAYSADDPPSQRALVQLDGVTGDLLTDPYVEAVPGS